MAADKLKELAALSSPAEVRQTLVHTLRQDLVGPEPEHILAEETLLENPSRWYLTGFLVPSDAPLEERSAEDAPDELDALSERGGADENTEPDQQSRKRLYFPSSIGLSMLIPGSEARVDATVSWGDYRQEKQTTDNGTETVWKRIPKQSQIPIQIQPDAGLQEHPIPGSGGLILAVSSETVRDSRMLEQLGKSNVLAVSVFLVNRRPPEDKSRADEAFVFQACLQLQHATGFVPRPDPRGLESADQDERINDLQYRDVMEFVCGHGVAARHDLDDDGECRRVKSCWIPLAEVERVEPAQIQGVELGMESLAQLESGKDARDKLLPLVEQYRQWIISYQSQIDQFTGARQETARSLQNSAQAVARRIEQGIAALEDDTVRYAFCLANQAMSMAARQRMAQASNKPADQVNAPSWRPFQLAFVLMTLPGLIDPRNEDRQLVDLLFFPTGGGKTEAYLGMAAFTLIYRRITHPGIQGAGVSVLMRYTLRLLTLDQLSRAAALVCALELKREEDPQRLGDWPFEIGLWVGSAATPNRMGKKGDNKDYTARAKTLAFQNGSSNTPPIPLKTCPWCGTPFSKSRSFLLDPAPDYPRDLRVICANRHCSFSGKPLRPHPAGGTLHRTSRILPIVAVDDPIFRRLPCFIIATCDKFASLPWNGMSGALFNRVERYNEHGFYGPMEPGSGKPLPGPLTPPDLIIQDELHLISGPLGTMVGLYETAIDALATQDVDGIQHRPKIVASTATVRRAQQQVRALFNRPVEIFPPPLLDRRDSFFARTMTVAETPGRQYLGIAAQGRSLKVVLLRVYLALMSGAGQWFERAVKERITPNPADPYMTLLGYFNSLRELGGSRRIIEEELLHRLASYGHRQRWDEREGKVPPLLHSRQTKHDVVELTSRESTEKVADTKRRLALAFEGESLQEAVDVAIATNMISVGLDITRLGLMVVFGQPKTSSEYIQATSRVGREKDKPGLVVTLLNIHRARDRSHYERYITYHSSFYRNVEATSVTPFSSRALDRGLAGMLVALARHLDPVMTPPRAAGFIGEKRAELEKLSDLITERAIESSALGAEAAGKLRDHVRRHIIHLLDRWVKIQDHYQGVSPLQYYRNEETGAKPLMHYFLDDELENLPQMFQDFRVNLSMRDVEPSVQLWMKTLDGREEEA